MIQQLEPAENLTLTLSNAVNMQLGSISTHTLTITDDDSPAVTIVANDASASEAGLDPDSSPSRAPGRQRIH